jgi:hypothetical protein
MDESSQDAMDMLFGQLETFILSKLRPGSDDFTQAQNMCYVVESQSLECNEEELVDHLNSIEVHLTVPPPPKNYEHPVFKTLGLDVDMGKAFEAIKHCLTDQEFEFFWTHKGASRNEAAVIELCVLHGLQPGQYLYSSEEESDDEMVSLVMCCY